MKNMTVEESVKFTKNINIKKLHKFSLALESGKIKIPAFLGINKTKIQQIAKELKSAKDIQMVAETVRNHHEIERLIKPLKRPTVQLVGNEFKDIPEIDIEGWKEKLEAAKPILNDVVPSVGRLELKNSDLAWCGTAWLVADNIIVTNRHVAEVFITRKNTDLSFKLSSSNQNKIVKARVDFAEDLTGEEQEFSIKEILYVATKDEADIAFFKIHGQDPFGKPLQGASIKLSDNLPSPGTEIVLIGYPARDSMAVSDENMRYVFQNSYGTKRLQPGLIIESRVFNSTLPVGSIIFHDASTTRGNSGSVIIDLLSGKAVGLHFGGYENNTANYAVSSKVIKEKLESL
jgi:endonuclease G